MEFFGSVVAGWAGSVGVMVVYGLEFPWDSAVLMPVAKVAEDQ